MEITDPTYWDSYWATSDKPELRDNDPHYGRHGYFLKAMIRHLGELTGKSIVELGGAMSYKLIAFAKFKQMQATAIDYAPDAVEKSREFYAAHGVDIELDCVDLFSPVLDDRKFDVVSHWGVVEHFQDPLSVLKRSVDLCAAGGKIIFDMPQMRGPVGWLWKTFSPGRWEQHVYHTDENIERCFKSLGWQCKRAFWGVPVVYMTPGQNSGAIPFALHGCQYFLHHAARLGVPYQYGLPYVSSSRGFVAWEA